MRGGIASYWVDKSADAEALTRIVGTQEEVDGPGDCDCDSAAGDRFSGCAGVGGREGIHVSQLRGKGSKRGNTQAKLPSFRAFGAHLPRRPYSFQFVL